MVFGARLPRPNLGGGAALPREIPELSKTRTVALFLAQSVSLSLDRRGVSEAKTLGAVSLYFVRIMASVSLRENQPNEQNRTAYTHARVW